MGKFNLLNGDVDRTMVEQVMEVYASHEEEYVFYLTTEGGDDYLGDIIIDLFNLHEQCTTLIIAGTVQSKGFDIFFKSKCHRSIMVNTFGMAHKLCIDVQYNGNGPIGEFNQFMSTLLIDDDKKSYEFYKDLGLTKEELDKFAEGKDVLFDYNRMKELLTNQTQSK